MICWQNRLRSISSSLWYLSLCSAFLSLFYTNVIFRNVRKLPQWMRTVQIIWFWGIFQGEVRDFSASPFWKRHHFPSLSLQICSSALCPPHRHPKPLRSEVTLILNNINRRKTVSAFSLSEDVNHEPCSPALSRPALSLKEKGLKRKLEVKRQ